MLQVSEKGLRKVMRNVWGMDHDEQTTKLNEMVVKGGMVEVSVGEYMMDWVEFYHMDTSFLRQLDALSHLTPEMEEDIYNTVDLFFLDEDFQYLGETDDEYGDSYRKAYHLFRNPYYDKYSGRHIYRYVEMVQLAAQSCLFGDFPMVDSLCKSLSSLQGD